MKINRVVSFLFVLLLTCSFTYAETLYVTVLEKDAGANLQKSSVTLKLDKKDIPVTDFLQIDSASRSAETLLHPAGRRQFLLLFDLLFSKPEEVVSARKTAVALLDGMSKDDLVAVAVLSRASGLRFWSGFTADRSKLNSALNAVGLESIPGMLIGPDGNLYTDKFQATSTNVELIPEEEFLRNVTNSINPPESKDKKKKALPDPAPAFVRSLNDLAFTLAGIQGRKNIVLFSPGFDAKGTKIEVEEESFADSYVDSAISSDTYIGTVEEDRADQEAARRRERDQAHKQNPVIQVEGVPDFVAGTGCTVMTVNSGAPDYEFFRKLATQTSGLYLREAMEPAAAAGQILANDQKYYVVGFEGRREKQFRDMHKLRVEAGQKLLRPVDVWVAPRNYELYTPVEKHLHVSQSQYKNMGAPMPGQKFWADFAYQQGPRVMMFSQMPGAAILKQDVNEFAIEAYGFLMDASGRIVDFSATPVRLDLKNKTLREKLGKAGVKIWSGLLGQPGPASVRWVFVDSLFGDTITWSQPIDVRDSGLTTTNPFIPSTNFDWLVWPKPQDAQTRRGAQIQYPYAIDQDMFFPELDAGIAKEEKDKVVYFKIYNRLPETKNPPIHMFLVDAGGKQTEIQQFALMRKPKEVEQGGMELFWKLIEVPNVPAGNYRLQVSIHDVMEKKDVVREMPIVIK